MGNISSDLTASSGQNTIRTASHESSLRASVKKIFLRERFLICLESDTVDPHGDFLQMTPDLCYKDLSIFPVKTASPFRVIQLEAIR